MATGIVTVSSEDMREFRYVIQLDITADVLRTKLRKCCRLDGARRESRQGIRQT